MKRLIDIAISLVVLVMSAPLIGIAALMIWLEDRGSPFYMGPRVGLQGREFRMAKLRSMVVNAHTAGIDSTSGSDPRITNSGRVLRRFKLDELPQFLNVLHGDMSLVGPRPNVPREVSMYTHTERRLLDVRPGITDLASIVFADEGEILREREDPDLAYNRLIRPWKSRLGLWYVEHSSVWLDFQLLGLTALSVISRRAALLGVARRLEMDGAPGDLIEVARRDRPLVAAPPPGNTTIVTSRAVDGREATFAPKSRNEGNDRGCELR